MTTAHAHGHAPARVLGWTGYRVDDVHGRTVGRLEAVLVDREHGKPQWLLVRLSSPAGQFTALPLVADMLAGAGHLLTPWTRDRILSAPRVLESGALSARNEREACAVFGVPFTRGAGLSKWERRATSARLLDVHHWTPEPRGTAVDVPRGTTAHDGPRGPDPALATTVARAIPEALVEAQRRAAGRGTVTGPARRGPEAGRPVAAPDPTAEVALEAATAPPAVHRPIAPGLRRP